jgi:superfamily II DNA/RNA helicase
VINPATGEAVAELALATPADVDIAVASARAALPAWSGATPAERSTVLARLAELVDAHAAEIVADKLRKAGLDAEPLHGQLSQGKRSQVLDDFRATRIRVVVATDLAARGIDVVELPVVVNYDLPRSADDYTHRIGRTGRAGQSGLAVSFVTADTEAHWRLIEARQGLDVVLEAVEGFEPTEVAAPPQVMVDRSGNGGVKGKRPSKKDKLRAAAALNPGG